MKYQEVLDLIGVAEEALRQAKEKLRAAHNMDNVFTFTPKPADSFKGVFAQADSFVDDLRAVTKKLSEYGDVEAYEMSDSLFNLLSLADDVRRNTDSSIQELQVLGRIVHIDKSLSGDSYRCIVKDKAE